MARARATLTSRPLGRAGLWAELSAAVGLAGLRAAPREEFDGPVVCVSTSAGFKDQGAGRGRRGSRSDHPGRHGPQPSRSRAHSANEVTGIPRARASSG